MQDDQAEVKLKAHRYLMIYFSCMNFNDLHAMLVHAPISKL